MLRTYAAILGILDPVERRRFFGLALLVMLMGLFDVLGIASILPFLAVVANPEVARESRILEALQQWSGITEPKSFLVILAILVLFSVTVGLAFRAIAFAAIVRFTRKCAANLAMRLLKRYLERPYAWFLGQHSANLGKTLLSEVQEVTDRSIAPAMHLLAHLAAVLFIVSLLIAIDPIAALAAATIMAGSYGIAYLTFQRRLTAIGRLRFDANKERYRIAQEALQGIKDVKIRGLEAQYISRFKRPAHDLASYQARLSLISELPRYVFEGIAVWGMVLFVVWLIVARESRLDAMLPIIGAYAFAGVRLFPTLQKIFRSLTVLRFGRRALSALGDELSQPRYEVELAEEGSPDRIPLTERLELREIGYAYPSSDRPILRGISLKISAHSVVGFAGPSGAGKSTLIDILMGLLVPTEGRLLIDGREISDSNRRAWRTAIGYVPQEIFLLDTTLAANIAFGEPLGRIDRQAVERAGQLAGVESFVGSLPKGYDTEIGDRGVRLSGGQRQRLAIARALYRDPEILIFDEATSSLDTLSERAVMEAVESLGRTRTIIKVAHRLSTLRDCDRIFLLQDGLLVASGRYEELVKESEIFQSMHDAVRGGEARSN